MTQAQTSILLLNLGTPESATVPAVRRFLREFLSDPFVVKLPGPLRWLLLNGIILPFRTKTSTEAYQKIWTAKGSPLMIHSQQLQCTLQKTLGEQYHVELAMRYGEPDIASALTRVAAKNCERLIVVPLFPQYAESTTASSLQKTKALITKHAINLPVTFLQDFYDHPKYIESSSELIKTALNNKPVDKVIFSYHGLPENHIHTVCSEKKACDLKKPCPVITDNNQQCYRAQCYSTSHLIAKALSLSPKEYIVTFQSRLGRTPWITPYTDHLLNELAADGIKNIAITCPSLVSDCLETLEEIDIRARAQWRSLGGDQFTFVPCLNANKTWVDALATIIDDALPATHLT